MKLFIFLFSIFSFAASALEYNDVLPRVNVIKAYKNNILVINRGLEDGIYKGDHIKLTNQSGYIARAICIKTHMLLSHWKVYRVVHPELLSFDENYRLTSMNQSEIPKDLRRYRTADFSGEYNDISDTDAKKPIKMQQERLVSFDLSTDTKNDPIIEEAKKDGTDKFFDRNFSKDQFFDDFKKHKLTLSFSPISYQSINNQKLNRYQVALNNTGKKYQYFLEYRKNESKQVDELTDAFVYKSSTFYSAKFKINKITENFSYFFSYSEQANSENRIRYPAKRTLFGLVGFEYNVYQDKLDKNDYLHLSYTPLMDNTTFDTIDSNKMVTGQDTTRQLRHGLELDLSKPLTEKLAFTTNYKYRPAMNLSDQKIDFNNNLSWWTSNLTYSFKDNVKLSYQYIRRYDVLRSRYYDLRRTNVISSIFLHLSI